ncbi:OmpA family protein [Vibrio algicola]|uniref:OmpA family protein n=1 Tax=Vibrio algicola TaxID=2662262 RepID=A0A5Q0TNE9_9VIBR|nr:OmpA family protein [Vibrio algicola]
MKTLTISLMVLLLSACSVLDAPPPPLANQQSDIGDADADGVINARDKCLNTPANAVVDNDGCPEIKVVTEQKKLHILFANDSDEITQLYLDHINAMSQFLAKYPKTYIVLNGYASPVGPSDHNLNLSRRRAANVYKALISSGVESDRIQIIGFGDSEPVAGQTKEEINKFSRRVTATVEGMDSSVVDSWTIYDKRKD